jgi:hypothetical protein
VNQHVTIEEAMISLGKGVGPKATKQGFQAAERREISLVSELAVAVGN